MNYDPVIRVEGVRKAYGQTVAVRDLSLSVPVQSVYGFLGPNGAGKSTTIRMILGLHRPDCGSVWLFGRPLAENRVALLRRVGSLVESPSLYMHLTGRENLEVHRRLLAIAKPAIQEALELVGLASVADRAVRGYSSGMQQRLGLAVALLGNPDLLILDEPTNGLDPAGIQEVRSLVRRLPARGVTVFLSSHLLAEVEQVATQLAIISHGELKFEGTQRQLQELSEAGVVVEVDEPERACALLADAGYSATRENGSIRIMPAGPGASAAINALLVQAGFVVSQVVRRLPSLEDLFLRLTGASEGLAAKEGAWQER